MRLLTGVCYHRSQVLTPVRAAAQAPFTLSANFALVGLLKGNTTSEIASKVKQDIGPTWLAGTCYWQVPPPPRHHPAFTGMTSI